MPSLPPRPGRDSGPTLVIGTDGVGQDQCLCVVVLACEPRAGCVFFFSRDNNLRPPRAGPSLTRIRHASSSNPDRRSTLGRDVAWRTRVAGQDGGPFQHVFALRGVGWPLVFFLPPRGDCRHQRLRDQRSGYDILCFPQGDRVGGEACGVLWAPAIARPVIVFIQRTSPVLSDRVAPFGFTVLLLSLL